MIRIKTHTHAFLFLFLFPFPFPCPLFLFQRLERKMSSESTNASTPLTPPQFSQSPHWQTSQSQLQEKISLNGLRKDIENVPVFETAASKGRWLTKHTVGIKFFKVLLHIAWYDLPEPEKSRFERWHTAEIKKEKEKNERKNKRGRGDTQTQYKVNKIPINLKPSHNR